MARFQVGEAWPFHGRQRWTRGPGKGEYRMSDAAYQARLKGLAKWRRLRTPEQSRDLQIAIVRAAGQESYRSMGARLGVAYSYCRRVATRYYGGQVPVERRPLSVVSPERASEAKTAAPARKGAGGVPSADRGAGIA
jgi:hypothetical protein